MKKRNMLFIAMITSFLLYLFIDTVTDRNKLEELGLSQEADSLHPVVVQKKAELVQLAKTRNISILITDGFRSHSEQEELYEQGRTTPGPVVTKARAGTSYHNYGLAIDFALLTKEGKALWDTEADLNENGSSDWMEVVQLAKGLGFEWGGDWPHFPDYPHLQMDFGLSIAELQQNQDSAGVYVLKKIWNAGKG
ncbi:hypothetical protein SY83_16860 [Paenibacillus swuensis]|uniref:Peptidase M15C domain-containing protein n=1 Tax=Paenibacillus swuensis TaxID=1178515 RepID=A0A172TL23_9BACL|nr:M15 family metallopeptidase [Paenibacillus swuensis]ANE47676.1 hypothetical protein SY83_16860 [Paenibacillus swuensis]